MRNWLRKLLNFTIIGPLLDKETYFLHKHDQNTEQDLIRPISISQCEAMVKDTFRKENTGLGCSNCLKLAEALDICLFNLKSKGLSVFQNFLTKNTHVGLNVSARDICEDMEVVMNVVKLGRAVRNDLLIKIKQPLPELYIQTSKEIEEAIKARAEFIMDELNVKDIKFVQGLTRVIILPNLAILGKKLGPKLKHIQSYLKNLNPKQTEGIVDLIKNGKSVDICGFYGTDTMEVVTLEFGELLLSTSAPKGTREDNGIAVSFNTEIDQKLMEEYVVREISREINMIRRENKCQLTEIVEIYLMSTEGIEEILEKNREYLESHTLCRIWVGVSGGNKKEITIGDEPVSISIFRTP